ncbi:MAG TPA: TIGR04211 family SH3 domain-containing protein [Gammaproteobacteria bacterium]|uniref:TIGR04211 family SH3 domain-containing protein n=1 Tax=Immundisolibacter sp. TaxID=1934948 RepID=UPI000E98F29D|nr:TIGR04211 family SH3 domain-containing protein [Gammaproteobacteria bacterium]HCZ47765.1 TIGR04211 family SH3 domain-containing protein [Gammaproteobacteria bacterium]MCH77203.1 TIGR04211 family SH3 domain-containing protein [Gammaproteobacteria bacterium]
MSFIRRLPALALAAALALPCVAAQATRTEGVPPDPAQELRRLQREHDALLARQPALEEAAAQAAELVGQNAQLQQHVQALQTQVDGLRDEAGQLRREERRRWFLTGAGVLAGGVVLGLVLPLLRPRRRRSYGGFL